MTKRKHTKLVHEGQYVAEVDVELIDAEEVCLTECRGQCGFY